MPSPMDEYLDRINAGTAEATPEAFEEYAKQVKARIEEVVKPLLESLEEPAKPGPEGKEETHLTAHINITDHTRYTNIDDVMHVNDYQILSANRFKLIGLSYKTKTPIVITIEYPQP